MIDSIRGKRIILRSTADSNRQAIMVVDLGFGDAGKGSIIDFLARRTEAHSVVRFNGGAQAAHNVITPDGRHHTFAQFGSATFLPGVRSYLSRYMLIEPYALFNEEEHLRALGVTDAFSRLFIDRQALVITPFHRAANRLKELARGRKRHGSCGLGIGETMIDVLADPALVLRAGDLPLRKRVIKHLRMLREHKLSKLESLRPALAELTAASERAAAKAEWQIFESSDVIEIAAENYAFLAEQITLVDESDWRALMVQLGTLLLEGAQGVLLDEHYGFTPYTTWSTTTFANADALLADYAFSGDVTHMGIWRSYFTRHGPGPFVTEDPALAPALPEPHNGPSLWQRDFRRGYFDRVAARYALDITGRVDQLAVTHLDAQLPMNQWCHAYTCTHPDIGAFFDHKRQLIHRIKNRKTPTQEHQAQLSEHLFRCQPLYEASPDTQDEWLDELEVWSGIPITLTSWGPTANDKKLRLG